MSTYVKVKEGMIVSLLLVLSMQVFLVIEEVYCKGCFNQNFPKGEIFRFVDYCILLKQVF
jgi:hypothetical protein